MCHQSRTSELPIEYRALIEVGRKVRQDGIESLVGHEPVKLSHMYLALATVADLADGIDESERLVMPLSLAAAR